MRRATTALLGALLVAVLTTADAGVGAGSPWVATYLGPATATANALNDRGQVVGTGPWSSAGTTAFLWEKGRVLDLVPGAHGLEDAWGINEQGQIVGSFNVGSGNDRYQAYLRKGGTVVRLPALKHGAESRAFSINGRGDVVGASGIRPFRVFEPGGPVHGVIWRGGRIQDFDPLAPADINDRGQVVGSGPTKSGAVHAVLWQDGKTIDLGTLGGRESGAAAINNRGQIVGVSDTKHGTSHAFLWQNGRMTDLGTLGGRKSEARGISERGVIVGSSGTPEGVTHACVWQGGTMTDLGAFFGGTQSAARAVNDAGQIAGVAYARNGAGRGILWTRDP
jgi:probable HAF family extracellular repeat protein